MHHFDGSHFTITFTGVTSTGVIYVTLIAVNLMAVALTTRFSIFARQRNFRATRKQIVIVAHGHNLSRGTGALSASWIGIGYLIEGGLVEREWTTAILTHWTKCNRGNCYFTSILSAVHADASLTQVGERQMSSAAERRGRLCLFVARSALSLALQALNERLRARAHFTHVALKEVVEAQMKHEPAHGGVTAAGPPRLPHLAFRYPAASAPHSRAIRMKF
ncbi:hypothetical protein EVAR_63728_1 [Eumeta japonica]|uniref:Uncharacterized protein n=1 Tax=Eumeta variegata TaxID=151549 RepID=A0A4C1ZHX3_EUMVA|nr:hypothetical protein EVAR_63728_1 [Eumeta japonica]